MTKQTDTLKLSIQVNCMRILEILEDKDLEELRDAKTSQWSYNRIDECIELHNRMVQLRKDTIKVGKILYPKGGR